MSLFDTAFAFALKNEGGYKLTQTDADRGGLTMAGLTATTVGSYYGKPATAEQMRALTPQQVSDIYRKLYWLPLGFADTDPAGLCVSVFDAAVYTGVPHAATTLQVCLGVKQDGKLGPLSLAAMRQADGYALRIAFAKELIMYLCGIVQRDATQQKWLAGWLSRAIRPISMTF